MPVTRYTPSPTLSSACSEARELRMREPREGGLNPFTTRIRLLTPRLCDKMSSSMWLLALPEDILDRIDSFLNMRLSASFSIYRHDMVRYGEIRPYDAWFLEE